MNAQNTTWSLLPIRELFRKFYVYINNPLCSMLARKYEVPVAAKKGDRNRHQSIRLRSQLYVNQPCKTTNHTKHSVDKQIVRLFYALTFHVANYPDFRKIVEAFSNHRLYLHLMSEFLVQCIANLNIDWKTQKQETCISTLNAQ